MVRLLARVIGVGIETATCSFTRSCRERCGIEERSPVCRYHRLARRKRQEAREKGLARAGNARVRRGMIQLAWRFLKFQKGSALAQWYRERTASARRGTRNTMIVALARKLLIALWRLVTAGEVPAGVVMRAA